jgi:CRP-like cAMP-binding protein
MVRAAAATARSNSILAALPERDFDRLRSQLEPVELPLGTALYEAGSRVRQLYFPTSGIISLLQVMTDGDSAEIAVVGSEGVVGIAMFMGGETTPSRAIVQSVARAYAMSADVLKSEFGRGGTLQYLLLRYTQALITQMSQTAVCNRHHSVEQQLCRWLLMSIDRIGKNELIMTQELIANMLGVRREGVTAAASSLQRAGAIRYVRGRIEIVDRGGLEQRVCECYDVVKKEYARLALMRQPK